MTNICSECRWFLYKSPDYAHCEKCSRNYQDNFTPNYEPKAPERPKLPSFLPTLDPFEPEHDRCLVEAINALITWAEWMEKEMGKR